MPPASALTRRAFLEANRERPFFLYLTHFAVHTPLQAPEPLVRKYERKLERDRSQPSAVYAAMIESVDQSLGRSLVPLLEGRADPDPADLVWYYPHFSPQANRSGAAIRSGRWKLIEHYDPPAIEIYDLEADLGGTRDLAAAHPERTADLHGRLQRWIADRVRIPHRLNPNYDPALAAQERPA